MQAQKILAAVLTFLLIAGGLAVFFETQALDSCPKLRPWVKTVPTPDINTRVERILTSTPLIGWFSSSLFHYVAM